MPMVPCFAMRVGVRCRGVGELLLPLFPMNSVLFPDEPVPLCAEDDAQRRLVRDVMDAAGPGRIGVVTLREAAKDTGPALHDVGCVAEVRKIAECGDGRVIVIAAGTRRFRVTRLDRSGPYLRGEVELLAEETGDEAAAQLAAAAVRQAFAAYLGDVPGLGTTPVDLPALPSDPVGLSYLVAALIMADLPVKQSLLAEPDALARLTTERGLLSWEIAFRRKFMSTPMPEFMHSTHSHN